MSTIYVILPLPRSAGARVLMLARSGRGRVSVRPTSKAAALGLLGYVDQSVSILP